MISRKKYLNWVILQRLDHSNSKLLLAVNPSNITGIQNLGWNILGVQIVH